MTLFASGRLEPYSETWPRAGGMRSGCVYERPMWEPRISGIVGSALRLDWSTPDTIGANDHKGSLTMGQRRGQLDEATGHWNTPRSGVHGEPGPHTTRGDVDALEPQAQLWQTPSAADVMGGHLTRGGSRSGEMLLPGQAKTWPTPCAQEDNKTPEAHLAMKARMPGGKRKTITSCQVAAESWTSSRLVPVIEKHGEPLSPTRRILRRRLNPAFVCWLMGWSTWWTHPEPISFAAAEMELYHSKQQSRLWSLLGDSDVGKS